MREVTSRYGASVSQGDADPGVESFTRSFYADIRLVDAHSFVWIIQEDVYKKVKEHVEKTYGYDLSRTLDEIRPTYQFNETCQGTVPQAIECFAEGTDVEDVIRNAISIGGDSDTIAAIAGAITVRCHLKLSETISQK